MKNSDIAQEAQTTARNQLKKEALALTLSFVLLLSALVGTQLVNPASAQNYASITIKPDGSIEGTDKIQCQGDTYTFTDDIFGTIWIQTSNIVIDGAGYTLQGNGINTGQNSEIGILLGGPDLSRRECRAVLVKNLRISNVPRGIFSVGGSNNSFIGNYFDKSSMEIQGNANLTGNLIQHNTFINTSISYDYEPNGTDSITENNFVNSTIYVWLANAPVVDRNYWSDYNGTDSNGDGTGDAPYVIDEYNIDNRPLIKPVAIPEFSDEGGAIPNLPDETDKAEPFPTELVIVASGVSLAAVGVGLLIYFKKRKR